MTCSRSRVFALLTASIFSTACGATVVRSGLPAGRAPDAYDDRWHHAFLLGLVDASRPYDVAKICPYGWSEMRTRISVVTGLLQYLTIGIYTPSNVTIVCARTADDPPEYAGEEALPP